MSLSVHSREATLRRHRAAQAAEKRRRRAAFVIALALMGVLAIGGTVAFLVDTTNKVENTFTPATVKTDIEENFTDSVKSDVRIKNLNISTNIPAYIRAKVVVNWVKVDSSGGVHVYGASPVPGSDYTDWTTYVEDGWIKHGDYYYWTAPVNPNASTGVLIDEIAVLPTATVPSGYFLNVEILSEAIQASGAIAGGPSAVQDAWGVTIAAGTVTDYPSAE